MVVENNKEKKNQTSKQTNSVHKGPFIATQLNSTRPRRRVELSCVAINGP